MNANVLPLRPQLDVRTSGPSYATHDDLGSRVRLCHENDQPAALMMVRIIELELLAQCHHHRPTPRAAPRRAP